MHAIKENGKIFLEDELGFRYRTATPWQQALSESIIDAAHGIGGSLQQCESETDWKVVDKLLVIFQRFFTSQYSEFLKNNKATASNQRDKFGLLEDQNTSKGGDINVRQLGTWPFELETMIRVVWPDQKFNRRFNEKFFRRFRAFRTAEQI